MNEILQKIHSYARQNYIPIIDDNSLDIFRDLIAKYQPKRVLEVGTAVGYSTSIIATNSDCIVDTIEINSDRIEIAKDLWQQLDIMSKINSYIGDVDEVLADVVKDNQYDLVFLDGPKSRYRQHLEICYPNIKKGGIIIVDDVLFFGLVNSDKPIPKKHRTIVRNLRAFIDYIRESGLYKIEILEKGNGLAVLEKL